MLVYHTGKSNHAWDLTGKGAELFGGRWNATGIPCIYASATKSLSILEYAVNVKLNRLPNDLSITTYKIPDDSWREISKGTLPLNWQDRPSPPETIKFGSAFLLKKEYAVIKIPSVIIIDEFNYILNPLHPAFGKIKIVEVSQFIFDVRIKQ